MSMPFSLPDFALRLEIWKSHVPGVIVLANSQITHHPLLYVYSVHCS